MHSFLPLEQPLENLEMTDLGLGQCLKPKAELGLQKYPELQSATACKMSSMTVVLRLFVDAWSITMSRLKPSIPP